MNRLIRARILQLKNATTNKEVAIASNSPVIDETPVPASIPAVDAKVADDVENVIDEVIEPKSPEIASLDLEEPKEVEIIDSTYKKKANTLKGKMT